MAVRRPFVAQSVASVDGSLDRLERTIPDGGREMLVDHAVNHGTRPFSLHELSEFH
jgi:hypothetical protein